MHRLSQYTVFGNARRQLSLNASGEIVRHAPAYNKGQLRLEEKYQILILNSANTLNKRSEINFKQMPTQNHIQI